MLLESIPAKGPWLWWVKARREGSVPDGPVTWVQFYENANGNGMGAQIDDASGTLWGGSVASIKVW